MSYKRLIKLFNETKSIYHLELGWMKKNGLGSIYHHLIKHESSGKIYIHRLMQQI